jgi:Holliday junction DNA helicase RuvA
LITHIEGILRKKNPDVPSVEVEVGGLWYEVQLPFFVWRTVEETPEGESVSFDVLYHVAERQPTPKLVGFTREIERDFFRKFIEVHDLGPTRALKAMTFSVSTIAGWIEKGDVASLMKLPGIGKRGAETIVAQLRGKVTMEALLPDEGYEEMPAVAATPSMTEAQELAVDGLVSLGYKRSDAERWVGDVMKTQPLDNVEDIIRAVFTMRSHLL